jgi:hypothetical protein
LLGRAGTRWRAVGKTSRFDFVRPARPALQPLFALLERARTTARLDNATRLTLLRDRCAGGLCRDNQHRKEEVETMQQLLCAATAARTAISDNRRTGANWRKRCSNGDAQRGGASMHRRSVRK